MGNCKWKEATSGGHPSHPGMGMVILLMLRVAIQVTLSMARSGRVCCLRDVLPCDLAVQQCKEELFGHIRSTKELGGSFLLTHMPAAIVNAIDRMNIA